MRGYRVCASKHIVRRLPYIVLARQAYRAASAAYRQKDPSERYACGTIFLRNDMPAARYSFGTICLQHDMSLRDAIRIREKRTAFLREHLIRLTAPSPQRRKLLDSRQRFVGADMIRPLRRLTGRRGRRFPHAQEQPLSRLRRQLPLHRGAKDHLPSLCKGGWILRSKRRKGCRCIALARLNWLRHELLLRSMKKPDRAVGLLLYRLISRSCS